MYSRGAMHMANNIVVISKLTAGESTILRQYLAQLQWTPFYRRWRPRRWLRALSHTTNTYYIKHTNLYQFSSTTPVDTNTVKLFSIESAAKNSNN